MRNSFELRIGKSVMVIVILLKRSIAKMKRIKILKVKKSFTAKLILSNKTQESLTRAQHKKKMGTIIINFRVL